MGAIAYWLALFVVGLWLHVRMRNFERRVNLLEAEVAQFSKRQGGR